MNPFDMVEVQPRVGPVISAVGAALLAVSVFLPWYTVSITVSGAASAQLALNGIAQQYGNALLQQEASSIGAGFSALAGHSLGTLSAHQALKTISVVLLLLAALALLAALLQLAGISGPIETDGRQVAVVGILAVLLVLYRMVDHPASASGALSLSLTWGSWLALLSSVAIIVGGLWPTPDPRPSHDPARAWEFSG
jgi:hypothetical protein